MNNGSFVPRHDWLRENKTDETQLSIGFLLASTLLAAILRFYRLDGASLWVDEILTWNMIRPDRDLDLLGQVWAAIQAPVYLLVVWPLMRLQENEWMMRLPAAVFGVLTVPFFGILLGRILDHRGARLGTLLLAISPYHIWYSQEGRGYSFLIFFVVLMTLAFLELTWKTPRPGAAFAMAFAGALAVLSNMSGLFLLMAMGLAVLFFYRPENPRQWGIWALALGGAVLLSFPWILKASGIWAVDRILPGADTGQALRGQTTFSPMAIPYSFFTFFFGYSFGPSLRELHQPDRMMVLKSHLPLLVLGMVPVGMGLLSSLRHLGGRRLFLLVFVTVPMAILVALAMRNIKPWNPRYVSVVFPFLVILLSLGLTRLPGNWSRIGAILMIVLSFWALSGHYWNDRYAKADIRAAVHFVEEKNTTIEPILVPVVTGVFSFYDHGKARLIDSYNLPPLRSNADAVNYFKKNLAQYSGFWFVSSREWYFDPQGHLPVTLSRLGHLRLEKEFAGVKVYHWDFQEVSEPKQDPQ